MVPNSQPEQPLDLLQARDRELALTTTRHLADALRRASDAMLENAKLQAQRDAHLDRLAAMVGALAEKVGDLTTKVAVSQERLDQVRREQADMDGMETRLRALEDEGQQRKGISTAGNWFVRNWAAILSMFVAAWALLERKVG